MENNKIYRVYSEKKPGFDVEAKAALKDINENLCLDIKELKILVRYDISGISDEVYQNAKYTILSEPQVDKLHEEIAELDNYTVFAVEFLPGQFDQRADSAAQCIQILTGEDKPQVKVAKVYAIDNDISDNDLKKVIDYVINPVEARLDSLEKPETLDTEYKVPEKVAVAEGFINMNKQELEAFLKENGFAFDLADITFCQAYFKNTEKRDPTVTELKMIDTYWSDHCRHTTFSTKLKNVSIDEKIIEDTYKSYLKSRDFIYANKTPKDICLMDLATAAVKELRKKGVLDNLDESEEINACSIEVEAVVDGNKEKWLIMFKNETHNHPTEIEPFGGAATCLGGAIRDPLSGRSYVYQAMRVTGSGDPRKTLEETLPGKLPQRKISTVAASGYSSYGNQIGLATGLVREIYDESYVAKRMEIGAVVAAARKENVIREVPEPGDIVILLGGRTGRDGCGGATGSSKAHTMESLETCGAEVQKGNPPEERKLQRLFRKKEVANLIKRCNDFGAGGVSVAIGELADGLEINLDKVPKKYAGLDGTELAISESQERMAVVVASKDVDKFIAEAAEENIEATVVAVVTRNPRLKMYWNGDLIVDISREFLNSNGASKETDVKIEKLTVVDMFESIKPEGESFEAKFKNLLSNLNVCSQKGLIERFDSTIGAATVLMPFGGKYELTPAEVMAAKIPVGSSETDMATVMAYGYDPKMAAKSPFHSAAYAVVHSIAKVVAAGGDIDEIYLTFQEYFKRLGEDPKRWGEPLAALLGAFKVQKELQIAAIGGKDSMSGSFNDIDVVPTLVSFAIAPANAEKIISNEIKKTDSKLIWVSVPKDENNMPDLKEFEKICVKIYELIGNKKVHSAYAVSMGGIAEAILKMSFGNKIGLNIVKTDNLFNAYYGDFILEVDKDFNLKGTVTVAETNDSGKITINGETIAIDALVEAFKAPLNKVYPESKEYKNEEIDIPIYDKGITIAPNGRIAKPKVVIPVFPGTNCEYDSARQFELAGAEPEVIVFKNITGGGVLESIDKLESSIKSAQMIMIPGGFSGGDEPDGSGKFIATAFRNPKIKEAVMEMLYKRDGLMLGICNGFQALIKLGLVPYGEIIKTDESCPTLTYNTIGRHVSTMVKIKVMSNLSPWFKNVKPNDVYNVPVSHGEGRFVGSDELVKELIKNGQVATTYVDMNGNPTYDKEFNPNGSVCAIEGITSKDGRILGKMGHSERIGKSLYKNIYGDFDMQIFKSGVEYYE